MQCKICNLYNLQSAMLNIQGKVYNLQFMIYTIYHIQCTL